MRDNVDVSMYVGEQKASRIKPDTIDLSDLPTIEKPLPTVRNEPVGASPLSPTQPLIPSHDETERNSERFSERTDNRTEIRTEKRTVLPVKRQTKRYSFEFFVDQITRLKRIKNRVEENGENIFLSDLVREAVDKYLKEKDE